MPAILPKLMQGRSATNPMRPLPGETLGGYIRRVRKAAGLTQLQVADLAGTDTDSVRRIEAGRVLNPTPRMLLRIANVLELDLAVLFELCGISIPRLPMTLADYLAHKAGFPLPASAVAEVEAAITGIIEQYRRRSENSG